MRSFYPCEGCLLAVLTAAPLLHAQAPAVPAWAQPGSATHQQVAPPPDFHRPPTTVDTPIGLFTGQSDVGSAVVPGSASFDSSANRYTIHSAGYNIWYTRDEFRFLWKKMSGDASLAADIAYPDPTGYGDRKAVLVIRQSLDDDAKEALVAIHGLGMIHLAERREPDTRMVDTEFRMGGRGRPGGASPDSLVPIIAKRIGIEKRGDEIALFVSLDGEPCTSSARPSPCISTARFTLASVSVPTCPTSPTPPPSPTSPSPTPPARSTRVASHAYPRLPPPSPRSHRG